MTPVQHHLQEGLIADLAPALTKEDTDALTQEKGDTTDALALIQETGGDIEDQTQEREGLTTDAMIVGSEGGPAPESKTTADRKDPCLSKSVSCSRARS